MLQNQQMLSREIRKTIYIKHMVLGKLIFLQLMQKKCHLISGITMATNAEAIVGLQKQRKLLQLLRQTPLSPLGGVQQISRRNAAAFEFIHRIHQLIQKLRLSLQGRIRFQPTGQLPGSRCHRHDSTAGVHGVLQFISGIL